MRERGDILLVACYELGHQPLAVAWPAAALERAGFAPALLDVSVDAALFVLVSFLHPNTSIATMAHKRIEMRFIKCVNSFQHSFAVHEKFQRRLYKI